MPGKIHTGCLVEGCDRDHKSRGYCATHYQQLKRGVAPSEMIQSRDREHHDHCKIEGCLFPVKALGVCRKHYARVRRHGDPLAVRPKIMCSIEGCDEEAHARKLCTKHYYRDKRTGSTADPPKTQAIVRRSCSVSGCTQIAVGKGFCQTHLKRWQRHGDVRDTRAADWGSREKQPLYTVWKNLMRYKSAMTVERWHDLWNFVADLGDSRPTPGHLLTAMDESIAIGPDNFYWREPAISLMNDDQKAARAEYMRQWTAANIDMLTSKDLLKRYGITLDRYNEMLAEQGGVCAICGQEETRVDHRTKRVSRLAVDHDHNTGAVRGLLCHAHNNSLGHFGDDPVVLAKAIVYLASHSGDREAVITAAMEQLLATGADHARQ